MPPKARTQPEVPGDLTARLEGLLLSQQGKDAGFAEAEQLDRAAPAVDFEFNGEHYRATVERITED